MANTIVITGDGSSTLFVPELNEHYHSTFGAYQESMHVFIESGLLDLKENKREINLLEVGLGTGLNALLTFNYAGNRFNKINYMGIEPFPVDGGLLLELHYEKIEHAGIQLNTIKTINNASHSNEITLVNDHFELYCSRTPLQEIKFEKKFDLVYFDAFGPQFQPEMWLPENFIMLYQSMNEGGILVTYCAKGEVRRSMQAAGFITERIPGPKGKREMLRAKKIIS